jgi:hypothetical protein
MLSPEKMRIVRVPERKLGWWAIWVGIGVVEREGIGTGVRVREGGPWLDSLFSIDNGIQGHQRVPNEDAVGETHSLMCLISTTL